MYHYLSSFVLGLDSFVLCLGIGASRPTLVRQAIVSMVFGAADAGGTVIGTVLSRYEGWRFAGLPAVAPALIGTYGVLVLVSAASARRWAKAQRAIPVLALLMSLDNLASAALGDDGGVGILSSFVATGLMAFAGCRIGAALVRGWPGLERILPGGGALAAALIMALG